MENKACQGHPSNLRVGYEISAGDLFEWMVSNDEILDMLFGFRHLSASIYGELKTSVYSIASYIDWKSPPKPIRYKDMVIEGVQKPKQRKRTELTPYFFVLIPLDVQRRIMSWIYRVGSLETQRGIG